VLDVKGVVKSYEGQPLLKGVSLRVQQGETVCLLGPSGSGKSTLLRLIAGLEQPEAGRICWDGQDLASIPVHKRQFGLMFQDFALFPHRNVAENVAFGLRMQRLGRAEIDDRVRQSLDQVNLGRFTQRRVTDLSGGEQQRVALARALAPRPRLLMLDEPLGALDRALREQLLEELRGLLHRTGIPAIYVTHDQEEAFTIADRLAVLHAGLIEQDDTPAEVVAWPSSSWVANFLGMKNLIDGEVLALEPLIVRTSLGEFEARFKPGSVAVPGQAVTLLLRSGGARLAYPGNLVVGRVVDAAFRGEGYRLEVETAQGLRFQFLFDQPFTAGTEMKVYVPVDSTQCLPDHR
jgi:ABC-type Fe3+/spermidine/putrescine transport system ATPase subunit